MYAHKQRCVNCMWRCLWKCGWTMDVTFVTRWVWREKDVLYVKMFVELWFNDGCEEVTKKDVCEQRKMYVKRKRCVWRCEKEKEREKHNKHTRSSFAEGPVMKRASLSGGNQTSGQKHAVPKNTQERSRNAGRWKRLTWWTMADEVDRSARARGLFVFFPRDDVKHWSHKPSQEGTAKEDPSQEGTHRGASANTAVSEVLFRPDRSSNGIDPDTVAWYYRSAAKRICTEDDNE